MQGVHVRLPAKHRRNMDEYDGRSTDKMMMAKLEEIRRDIQKLLIAEAARVEHQAQIDRDVDALNQCVIGNGKPGLKTEVQIMKDQLGRVYALGGAVTIAVILDIVTRFLHK